MLILDSLGNPLWHNEIVSSCAAWRDPWGPVVSQDTRRVTGDYGTRHSLVVVSPGVEKVDPNAMFTQELSSEELASIRNRGKRFSARVENIADEVCRRR